MFKESIYKENPVITLMRTEDDRFPFSFGVSKAKLILADIEAIKAFVAKNEPTNGK
jgi:hypothetical protein